MDSITPKRLLRFIRHDWISNEGILADSAFKNFDGYVSLVCCECIDKLDTNYCAHLKKFYKCGKDGAPIIFWEVSLTDLQSMAGKSLNLMNTPSDSGDVCHRELTGLTDKEAKHLRKKIRIDDFSICDNGNPRKSSKDEILRLREQFLKSPTPSPHS